jgi:hypothetical protein
VSRVVGVYVCPRGVFGVECQERSNGVEVLRSFEAHGRIASPQDSIRHLARALLQHDIKRARLAIAVRGFGAVHHVLTFPKADDAVLNAIVQREVRRIEQQMADPVVAWMRLAPEEGTTEQAAQTDVLTAALPGDVVAQFMSAVEETGNSLLHLTVLSTAMQRLAEEFLPDSEPAAIVCQLPDGPFIGYTIGGAIRLAVEPPVRDDDALPDAAALSDEAELGSLFVRQQFHGAQITQAAVVASDETYPDVEAALGVRLMVPITRVPLAGLSPGAVAAFGAVLDARSARPVSLAGRVGARGAGGPSSTLQLATTATLVAVAIVAIWAVGAALQVRGTTRALSDVRRRIEAEASGFVPAQETADRRRMVRDAVAALQDAHGDRAALQRSIAAIAGTVSSSVSLDSMVLHRGESGWQAALGGSIIGQTSGAAVQALSNFSRELSELAPVESLSLRQLSYADTTGRSLVRFELVFGVLLKARD